MAPQLVEQLVDAPLVALAGGDQADSQATLRQLAGVGLAFVPTSTCLPASEFARVRPAFMQAVDGEPEALG